jgi:hypothetical protein
MVVDKRREEEEVRMPQCAEEEIVGDAGRCSPSMPRHGIQLSWQY